MRVFVGTMLSAAAQAWCRTRTEALVRQHRPALRSIPEGSAHLTHVFCPDLGPVPLAAVVDAVRETTTRWRPFEIQLGRLVTIPAGLRPRLVCLDVASGAPALATLSAAIVASLRRACPRLDLETPRSAHVTLARVRKQAAGRDVRAAARALNAPGHADAYGVEHIDRVDIVGSTLTEAGPVYEVLDRLPLVAA